MATVHRGPVGERPMMMLLMMMMTMVYDRCFVAWPQYIEGRWTMVMMMLLLMMTTMF